MFTDMKSCSIISECFPLLLGARLYPIFGTPSDFGNDTESSNIVNDFTCPNEKFDFQIYDCDIGYSNSTDGCLSYYPQPVITCLEGIIGYLYIIYMLLYIHVLY